MSDYTYQTAAGQQVHDNLPSQENDPKYKCCCRSVHVKQGALIIGIISFIFTAIAVCKIDFGSMDKLGLKSGVIWIPVLLLLFVGLSHNMSILILPFVVMKVLSLLELCLLFVVSLILAFDPSGLMGFYLKDEAELIRETATFYIIVSFIGLLIQLWLASVAYRCYQYMKDVEGNRRSTTPTVVYQKDNVV